MGVRECFTVLMAVNSTRGEVLNGSQGGFHCSNGCVQPSRRGFSVCVAARTLRRASRLCNRNCRRHKSKAV